jgi:hypothetical protein
MSNPVVMRRGLLAAALAASCVVPAHFAAATQPVPAVAGLTVIIGSSSGVERVRLPKTVTVTIRDVKISGAGRYIGSLFIPVAPHANVGMEFMQFGLCLTRGCRSPFPGHAVGEAMCCGDITTTTLPAGDYNVYLFADGAPVRATITFPGLTGTTTLHPSGPVHLRIDAARPTDQYPTPPGNNALGADVLYAAGDTHTVGHQGGALFWSTWKTEPLGNETNQIAPCVYAGKPGPGLATPAYQVPCDGGGNLAAGNIPVPFTPGDGFQVSSTGPIPGSGTYLSLSYGAAGLPPIGQVSIGFSHNTYGPAIEAHVLEVWFDW